jgi:plastocyanin
MATAAFLLLLLGSACADAEGPEPAAGGSGPDETAATGPTTHTGSAGGDMGSDAGGGRYDYGPGGADGGSGSGDVDADVVADNYAFAPAVVEATAGSPLSVGNANGGTPHTFTIDGTDVDVELEPMAVEEVTLDLDPGTYDFHCRFHASMTGTLTIS